MLGAEPCKAQALSMTARGRLPDSVLVISVPMTTRSQGILGLQIGLYVLLGQHISMNCSYGPRGLFKIGKKRFFILESSL